MNTLIKRGLDFVQQSRVLKIALMSAFMAIWMVAPATFAQSDTITFDLSPFFTSLNQYLPIFIGMFAIIGGIAGAMALARFVIGAVVNAFRGGTI